MKWHIFTLERYEFMIESPCVVRAQTVVSELWLAMTTEVTWLDVEICIRHDITWFYCRADAKPKATLHLVVQVGLFINLVHPTIRTKILLLLEILKFGNRK